MDLIKRYVYAVTKELPQSQREEIQGVNRSHRRW